MCKYAGGLGSGSGCCWVNTCRAKILTTENLNELMFLGICGDMINIVHGGQNQKYLGKKLSGDLRTRAMVDLQHQSQIAWMNLASTGTHRV